MQLFVNDLTVIDFSYLCRQRGVVGESWIVDVLLDGDLNDQSMVLDFGIVKKQIKAIIDDAVDHKLLLPTQDCALRVTNSVYNEGHEFVDFESERAVFYLQSPACAYAKIDTDEIAVESVTKHLKEIILEQLPTNVKNLVLTLRPEHITSDYYHYTHGLKKHDGNCQRIAHGHRSTIQLFKDERRDQGLESYWCERWRDIYIATDSDEIAKEKAQLSEYAIENLKPDHRFFSYMAPQGRFDIAVQECVLEVVDCDSTVELLADYIARQLKAQHPEHQLKVVAYEGVGKGAIASV
ncbi:6-carboxytetrahydropterin synthase [Thalassotalea atypica]|uniref:6-carboxytetrahydropterin synthase n=1 Tax=Thalassotalea atypica TaxID=2054316 RepID=UPI0025746253|nr:6-carboxytetrahydropterin synthase [Thalassotalea atypica]